MERPGGRIPRADRGRPKAADRIDGCCATPQAAAAAAAPPEQRDALARLLVGKRTL